MALKLITAPTATPVTLAQARAHLNLLDGEKTEDNTLIQLLLDAATSHIDGKDGWLQRALKPQTWELSYDEFPSGPIQIPLPPLISVSSLKYTDEDGVEQTIGAANYVVDAESVPGWVVPIADYTWPSLMDTINTVRVRFVAGYPDVSSVSTVPAAIKVAILITIGDWYEHRESVSQNGLAEIPMSATAKALLQQLRVFAFA